MTENDPEPQPKTDSELLVELRDAMQQAYDQLKAEMQSQIDTLKDSNLKLEAERNALKEVVLKGSTLPTPEPEPSPEEKEFKRQVELTFEIMKEHYA